MALIVSNCRLYNHAETPFCRAAALVEACWEKFRERFRVKYAAARAADAAAAAAANAAAAEGRDDKLAVAAEGPEEQTPERDTLTEQQGDLGKSFRV